MAHCELCDKKITGPEIFGPVGRTLCFACEQKRQQPQILSVEAYTVSCGTCGHSIDRYPTFCGDDYYFECEHCHADNVHIKVGRRIGPKSKHWPEVMRLIKEFGLSELARMTFDDEIKTDPPLEFCYNHPSRWWQRISVVILADQNA